MIRSLIKRWLGVEISYTVSPGFNFGNASFKRVNRRLSKERAGEALAYCVAKKPATVLDVGSGGGVHAEAFVKCGAETTCVDYGTSVYASNAVYDKGIKKIIGDFNAMDLDQKYNLVWASHVLEHQRNVGQFIDKLVSCCEEGGTIAITVPKMHRRLLGGHLTLWSPGLLAYNVVLAGVDIKDATVIEGDGEFSIVFSPIRASLPSDLTFDKNDIDKLSEYLPLFVREGVDQHRL